MVKIMSLCFTRWLTYLKIERLTLVHIRQICSRQLCKHLRKNMDNQCTSKCKYWIRLKPLLQKKNLLIIEQFIFLPQCFKSYLQQMRQKCLQVGKSLTTSSKPILKFQTIFLQKCFYVNLYQNRSSPFRLLAQYDHQNIKYLNNIQGSR